MRCAYNYSSVRRKFPSQKRNPGSSNNSRRLNFSSLGARAGNEVMFDRCARFASVAADHNLWRAAVNTFGQMPGQRRTNNANRCGVERKPPSFAANAIRAEKFCLFQFVSWDLDLEFATATILT